MTPGRDRYIAERVATASPEQLIKMLFDRAVAELHLAGATNREIATDIGCVERTVERKLSLLREKWRQLAHTSINASIDRVFQNAAGD